MGDGGNVSRLSNAYSTDTKTPNNFQLPSVSASSNYPVFPSLFSFVSAAPMAFDSQGICELPHLVL